MVKFVNKLHVSQSDCMDHQQFKMYVIKLETETFCIPENCLVSLSSVPNRLSPNVFLGQSFVQNRKKRKLQDGQVSY